MKILYNKASVRKEIMNLFSTKSNRKIAISAFVGIDAEYYLGNVKKLELYCWPKAGGTNPITIRNLISAGAKVQFVDGLHIKLYWAANVGAVISSANLSTNALGAVNLKEMGILIPDKLIDINKLIKSFDCKNVTLKSLSELDKETSEYIKKNPRKVQSSNVQKFHQWYNSPMRRTWKIGMGNCYGVASKEAIEICNSEFNTKLPNYFLGCKKNDYKKHDTVLTFLVNKKGISEFEWLDVDFIARDKSPDSFGYLVVQVKTRKNYNAPPFQLDQKFIMDFKKATMKYGIKRISNLRTTNVPKKLIDQIFKYYNS